MIRMPQITPAAYTSRRTTFARQCLALLMIASIISVGLLNKAQAAARRANLDPTFGINCQVTTDFSAATMPRLCPRHST